MPKSRERQPTSRGLLPVGRFFGVPLYFAPSWLLIAAFITLTYAQIIDQNVDDLAPGLAYLLAFGYAVLLAVSILLHELGHVAVSLALGNPVRRVTIFLLGGISEIEREPQRPRDEFLVSIAGPLVSIVLSALCWVGFHFSAAGTIAAVTFGLLTVSNAVVGVFNLLPGLPLDGGRVVRAGVWAATGKRLGATVVAAWAGRIVAVGFVVLVVVLTRDAFSVPTFVLSLLLAGFIWVGAGQSLRVAQVQARVPGVRVVDLVRPAVAVGTATPVSEALRQAWDTGARGVVVLGPDGRPAALVSEARTAAVPVDRRPWTAVTDVAVALHPGLVLPETLEGETLLHAVQASPAEEYLVVRVDGSTVGVLAAADVAARLQAGAGR
ncbi:site-2 protease family protein [Jatrophihabitans sp. YIM 134969]